MFQRLLQVYKNGGKTKGLRVAPAYMSWSMELLTRTSVNTYEEVRKVMRLPHISYAYKKSGKIISGAHTTRLVLPLPETVAIPLLAETILVPLSSFADESWIMMQSSTAAGANSKREVDLSIPNTFRTLPRGGK